MLLAFALVLTPEQILQASFSLAPVVGLDLYNSGWPVVGKPVIKTWHGRSALCIEMDGRKQTTKEAKIYFFVDPKTHVPLGVSMNLGSVTQVTIFKDMKINAKIDDSMFRWSPPSGWKEVKG